MVSRNLSKLRGVFALKLIICTLIIMAFTAAPFLGADRVANAAGGLIVSTSYPGVTVKAGENVDFSVRVENKSPSPMNVGLKVKEIPEGWESYFEAMGNQIHRVFVNSDDYTSVTYNVKVPAETSEGIYKIVLAADAGAASDTLELELNVSEKELTQGKFASQYPELQGPSDAIFEFKVDLANNSSKDQSYSLSAKAESGWEVSFSPSYEDKQIASLSVEAGKSQGLEVRIKPPKNVKAGEYVIPCAAVSADETLVTELCVIITGTYNIELSTPSGRLNADAYADRETPVQLIVTNTGSADLKDVTLSSLQPQNWSVRFEPESLDALPAGQSKEVKAYIKPASNAIAGDYVVALSASVPETSSEAEFRVTVKTPTAWGIVGVVIILLIIGGLFWIFRVYGRR